MVVSGSSPLTSKRRRVTNFCSTDMDAETAKVSLFCHYTNSYSFFPCLNFLFLCDFWVFWIIPISLIIFFIFVSDLGLVCICIFSWLFEDSFCGFLASFLFYYWVFYFLGKEIIFVLSIVLCFPSVFEFTLICTIGF